MDRGFSGMDEGGGSEGANKLAAIQAQLNSRFQQVLDKLTPRTHVRWGIFAFVVLLYALRVRLLEVSRVAGRNHLPSWRVQCALGSFGASVGPPKPCPEVRRTDEVLLRIGRRHLLQEVVNIGPPTSVHWPPTALTAPQRDLVQRAGGASVGVRLDWFLSDQRVGGDVPGLLHRDLRSGHLSSQPADWLPVTHGGS